MTELSQQNSVTFQYESVHIYKSQIISRGTYGTIYKAKCDQLPCAAKLLHQISLDTSSSVAWKIIQRRCKFLETVQHPHLVQYMGMTIDPESRLPVLLMELVGESLTRMLECSKKPLAHYIQVNICHDIALAVAYLHSNGIIHRRLSSNNVLLIAGSKVKVTDFGMHRLASEAPTNFSQIYMHSGLAVYMPPEALREPPIYTTRLDCFSEGVIMIQVCTKRSPEPGPRSQILHDLRSPTGVIEMPVLEIERRKNHIELIDPAHPLLSIAKDCLHYQETKRPSSEELCQRLFDLKESSRYRESMQQMDQVQMLKLNHKMRDLVNKERVMMQQIQRQQHEIQLRNVELHDQERLLQQKENYFQQELADRKEQILQRRHELKGQEKITAELQQNNISLRRKVGKLKELLSLTQQKQQSSDQLKPSPGLSLRVQQLVQEIRTSSQFQDAEHVYCSLISYQPTKKQPSAKPSQKRLQSVTKQKIILEWRDGGKAPFVMERGGAVGNGNIAYFVSIGGEMCSYNVITKTWSELPKCSYGYCSLAVISGHLTAIGGCTVDKFDPKDKLFSLMDNEGWTEHFPPMPTKRWKTAAVSTKHHLIVAGGKREKSSKLKTVEVMDIENSQWSTAASLPNPYCQLSATICGNHLYMLGGFDDNGMTNSVLTCSLADLLQLKETLSIWHSISDVLSTCSTCAAVNGRLLAVGGLDAQNRTTSSVHVYDPIKNCWNFLSLMPTAQCNRLVAVLPTNEMIVVGGYTRFGTDKVDIAKANIVE